MTLRAHLDTLRQVDPVTLEILLQEPLRRPMTQLSGLSIVDMIALADVEAVAKPLRRSLVTFTERVGNELRDLPDVEVDLLIADLAALSADRLPMSLRTMLEKEAELRDGKTKDRMDALLASCREVEPAPIALGTSKPVVLRPKAAPQSDDAPKRTRAPKAEGAPRTARAETPKRAAPVKMVDGVRAKWLSDVLLERLDTTSENGLREDVLVAGIKHRARQNYPDLTPIEIVGVLRDLAVAGRVRVSAGRWRRIVGAW